jgi:hypothetical protein
LRLFVRHDAIRRQRVADDLVVLLGIKAAIVDADAGAAGRSLRHTVAEALDHVGAAFAVIVFERDEEAAGRRPVILIVAAAPGVDVKHAVRIERHLPGVAEIVGEHGGAEIGRQRNAAIVADAGVARILRHRRRSGEEHQADQSRGNKRRRDEFYSAAALLNVKCHAMDHDYAPSSKVHARLRNIVPPFPTRARTDKGMLSQN